MSISDRQQGPVRGRLLHGASGITSQHRRRVLEMLDERGAVTGKAEDRVDHHHDAGVGEGLAEQLDERTTDDVVGDAVRREEHSHRVRLEQTDDAAPAR